MKSITIGFSKPKAHGKIFSTLIRLFQGTEYSHVYIKMHTKANIDVVYQASGSKVNFMNFDLFNDEVVILKEFTFEITDEIKNEILAFCFKYVGTEYGVKQVLGMGLVRLLKLIGIKMANPFEDGLNTMVCSEVVGRIMQFIVVDFKSTDFDNLDVKDVYDYVNSIKQKEIV